VKRRGGRVELVEQLSADEGADTAIWLATLPAGGPDRGFFRGRRRIPWCVGLRRHRRPARWRHDVLLD
jgi:hypothetical protein